MLSSIDQKADLQSYTSHQLQPALRTMPYDGKSETEPYCKDGRGTLSQDVQSWTSRLRLKVKICCRYFSWWAYRAIEYDWLLVWSGTIFTYSRFVQYLPFQPNCILASHMVGSFTYVVLIAITRFNVVPSTFLYKSTLPLCSAWYAVSRGNRLQENGRQRSDVQDKQMSHPSSKSLSGDWHWITAPPFYATE